MTTVSPRAGDVVPQLRPGVQVSYDSGDALPPLDEALAGEVMREQDERTLAITGAQLGHDGAEGVVDDPRRLGARAARKGQVGLRGHRVSELRSPLTSIKGFVELLGRSNTLGERERESPGPPEHGSPGSTWSTTCSTLRVSRPEKMEVHPRLFDVSEVVHEVATLMAPRLSEKEQSLDVRVPPAFRARWPTRGGCARS